MLQHLVEKNTISLRRENSWNEWRKCYMLTSKWKGEISTNRTRDLTGVSGERSKDFFSSSCAAHFCSRDWRTFLCCTCCESAVQIETHMYKYARLRRNVKQSKSAKMQESQQYQGQKYTPMFLVILPCCLYQI